MTARRIPRRLSHYSEGALHVFAFKPRPLVVSQRLLRVPRHGLRPALLLLQLADPLFDLEAL